MTMRWHGQDVTNRVHRAAARSLRSAAEHLLEQSNRTVPIQEGTLMRSGTVTVDEQRLEAAVSYDTPYAIRQHEDLTLRHLNGRRAKWLELTLQERQMAIRDFIVNGIRSALR